MCITQKKNDTLLVSERASVRMQFSTMKSFIFRPVKQKAGERRANERKKGQRGKHINIECYITLLHKIFFLFCFVQYRLNRTVYFTLNVIRLFLRFAYFFVECHFSSFAEYFTPAKQKNRLQRISFLLLFQSLGRFIYISFKE